MRERIFLFVLAITAAFFINAGLHDLSRHSSGGWLYFVGGLLVIVLLSRSWRRLAASLRKGGPVPPPW